jgi:hypothetical protein
VNTLAGITPHATKNGGHIPRLREAGCKYVNTGAVTETALRLGEAVEERGILILSGNNGLGKSVAGQLAVGRVQKATGIEVVRLEATSASETRILTLMLANQFGVPYDARQLPFTRFCIGAAMEPRRLILWVDEANNLHRDVLLALRSWHDRADAQWTLMLSGTGRMIELLRGVQPELLSRADRTIEFNPLAFQASVAFARGLHARFAATDEALLERAEGGQCIGVPRRWAQLLADCLRYSKGEDGGFNATVMSAAMRANAR